MSPVRVTWSRTIGQARNAVFSACVIGGCLAAMGFLLSFGIGAAEGLQRTLPSLWSESVAPILPVLAALLSMGVWSDERRSGRIELLLSTAVYERDLVLGKFLGVWTMMMLTSLFSLCASWFVLSFFSAEVVATNSFIAFIPAILGVALQCALWCAVSVAASTLFESAAAAACLSIAVTMGLPSCIWLGLMAWAPHGRLAFGQNPVSAQALDMASGTFSFFPVTIYLVGTALLLFFATKKVIALRFVGRGAHLYRASTRFVRLLLVVFATLIFSLAARLDFSIDIPIVSLGTHLSSRTQDILRESEGTVSVTCFLPRSDARFRETCRFLRLLKRASESVGGAEFALQYVDPRWDIGAAERLVSRGVMENSLVFERARRLISVPLTKGVPSERDCAAAIRRLATVPRRRTVYWSTGHGESRFDDYGPFGLSDIARDLTKEGYVNRSLDLATADQIPGDCALIVVAGAKDLFSRNEFGKLESYLREGGRVLVLVGSSREGGLSPLLPAWGVRLATDEAIGESTLSGSDIVVSDFAEHPLSAPFNGSRIVLERPVAFAPSAVSETKGGADRSEYAPLARSGSRTLAAVVERGSHAGSDLAIRPSRLVVVGDVSFVMNASLAARANANRDFFLNCAAYLSGTDALGSTGTEPGLFVTGFDRTDRFRFMLMIAVCVPGGVMLFLFALSYRRRRRS